MVVDMEERGREREEGEGEKEGEKIYRGMDE